MPTAAQIVARAAAQVGNRVQVGICQKWVRQNFGSPGGAPTAVAAWQNARFKHTSENPPPGAAVYWGEGAGHVAISAGNGMVYTTDYPQRGSVGLAPIAAITSNWGKPYLGWSEDNNGIRVTRWDAQPVKASGATNVPTRTDRNPTTVAGGDVATTYDPAALAAKYGYAAEFFNSNPELKKLLAKATAAQMPEEDFLAALRNTTWYRKTSEAQRKWQTLKATQPGEVRTQIADRTRDVVQLYRQMGVPIPPKRVRQIAEDSLRFGWDDDALRRAVADEFRFDVGTSYGGVAGRTLDEFREMSRQWLVPMSDATQERWVEHVLAGEADPEDFENHLRTQAKSLFPELAPAIDKGVSVEQYLDPMREVAAQQLEINPAEIDWFDPKWSGLVFATDETGTRRPRSLAEVQKTVRTDATFGYDKTTRARSDAAKLGSSIAALFGADA